MESFEISVTRKAKINYQKAGFNTKLFSTKLLTYPLSPRRSRGRFRIIMWAKLESHSASAGLPPKIILSLPLLSTALLEFRIVLYILR